MSNSIATLPKPGPRLRFLYGFGSVAYGVKDNGFSFFLMIYYNQVLGLPGAYAGLAIMIALLFDAVSDPLVGYWSDNTKSRWGRRHPFMYAAAVPVAVSYFLLWNPPAAQLGHFGLFCYLLVAAIFVRFFITLYEIPSTSIISELTDDYDERTRLMGFRYMFGWYGGLAMAVLGWGVFFADTPEYPSGVLNPAGYVNFSLVGAVAIFVSIIVSSLALHPYIPFLRQAREKQSFSLSRVFIEVRHTLSNKNFLALFVAGLFAAVGAGISTNFNAYMNTYFWGFTSADIKWINISLFASATLAAVLAPYIAKRFDKKRAAMCIYACSICFSATPVILRLFGWFPDNDSPYLLTIMVCHGVLDVTLIVMFGIVQSSMLADVVEHSQQTTGRREEGLFFAARTFAQKATSGLGTFIAGIALDLISFPIGSKPDEVPDEVIFDLGLIYGPLLMLFYFMALAAISFYNITRKGHDDRVKNLDKQLLGDNSTEIGQQRPSLEPG